MTHGTTRLIGKSNNQIDRPSRIVCQTKTRVSLNRDRSPGRKSVSAPVPRTAVPIAERKGVTPGQLALAWLLAKGEDIVPIPGTKRRIYLEENAAAADIKLSAAEVAEIQAAVPEEEVAGDRYAAENMKNIDR